VLSGAIVPVEGPARFAQMMTEDAGTLRVLERTRDVLGEIATATDVSAESAARYVMELSEVIGPGGALEQALARLPEGYSTERSRLEEVQEQGLVVLQTMVDIAQGAAANEAKMEALNQAMETLNAPPDERGRLAQLPELMRSAADAAGQLRREEEQAAEEAARRNFSVDKYITGLEAANELEQLSTEEKRVQEALLRAQALLVDNQGRAMRELTATERERIENAVRTSEAIAAQKRAAEELRRIVEGTTEEIVDYAAKPFVEIDPDVLADPAIQAEIAAEIEGAIA
jgi:small-conductance mechanosensitive channel